MKILLKSKKVVSSLLAGVLLFSISSIGEAETTTLKESEEVITAGSGIGNSKFNLIQDSPLSLAAVSDREQRVIVTFKDKKKVNKSLIQKGKGKIKRESKQIPSLTVSMPANEVEKLKNDPSVASVEPDIQLQAAGQIEDWGVTATQATYAWDKGYTGKGVKIAVLDTGISLSHEDLIVEGGTSFVDYTTSYDDDSGHGTHVAGIIGAKNNHVGTIGMAPDSSLYAVKVLDSHGTGYLSDVIAGIDWAIENKMDIVNLSMATSVDSQALHNAVDNAYAGGLLVVAAAGNAGTVDGTGDTIQFPAKYSSVISVGAVDQNKQRAASSSTGSNLEIVAPGVGINSTYLNNGYTAMSGTSMAAAFVSGELAMLKQENPTFTASLLRNDLDEHVIDLGGEGRDVTFGFGLLNASARIANNINILPNPTVVSSVYNNVYSNLVNSAGLGPSVTRQYVDWSIGNWVVKDETQYWPNLQNAKSISYVRNDNSGREEYIVLYSNNTVVRQYVDWSIGNWVVKDETQYWPNLQNAKSISYVRNDSNGREQYIVLYDNNTVVRKYVDWSIGNWVVKDETQYWPNLQNAKSISYIRNDSLGREQYIVLYNNNTVVRQYVDWSIGNWVVKDETQYWPNLQNVNSISYARYDDDGREQYTVARLDVNPIFNSINYNSQVVYKSVSGNVITLTGTISDWNNDNVTISASIAGVTKSTVVSNTRSPQTWTLQWNALSDNIPAGSYSNIIVTANDGLWGTGSTTYTGTITVDNVPNVPSNLTPGNVSASTPTLVAGLTPAIYWFFSDPDAGDIQSAYDVQIYNSAGTTLLYDSGWITSSSSSYSIPSNILARGATYGWRVAVRDNKGGTSSFSPIYYLKPNGIPIITLNSYADGQQMSDNVLTFAWTYADADGQAQTSYRVQGSKDNWFTVGYDSGVVSGSSITHTTSAIPDGTWNFRVSVYDGMEWSAAAQRSNLNIPNAYEPNNTYAQAFAISYNTLYTSAINSASDIDFYKYTAPTTGMDRVTFTMPADKNFDVYIYDSNMNFVVAGVASGAGVTENIIFPVTAGAVYYVKITGANGDFSTSNSYSLKVNKYTLNYNTGYQYDANGNIIGKQTNSN
jgi:subtilisin family serine protease